jgi:hypothetical protein
MATSAVSTLRQTLKTRWVAALTSLNVPVFAYPATTDSPPPERVQMGDARATQTHLAMGGSRSEDIELEVQITTIQPGAGETDADTSEDRAFTILAAIENDLRTSPSTSGIVLDTEPSEITSSPTVHVDGRQTVLDFTVTATIHI